MDNGLGLLIEEPGPNPRWFRYIHLCGDILGEVMNPPFLLLAMG